MNKTCWGFDPNQTKGWITWSNLISESFRTTHFQDLIQTKIWNLIISLLNNWALSILLSCTFLLSLLRTVGVYGFNSLLLIGFKRAFRFCPVSLKWFCTLEFFFFLCLFFFNRCIHTSILHFKMLVFTAGFYKTVQKT